MTHAATGRLAPLALVLTLLAGCTYYPTVVDTGSPRLEPKNGRLVRTEGGAVCYFQLDSTGKYGDLLVAAESQVARRVQIVTPDGAPVATVDVPGESRIDFRPDGLRIALSELTQPLTPGDGVIVTLVFAKSGRIGIVSRVE
jgi:copper(I)-binding protein